jgi:hypothetical protein
VYFLRHGDETLEWVRPREIGRLKCLLLVLSAVALLCLPSGVQAMTAKEILDQVAKKNFSESFRVALTIKTVKGKKTTANHSLWVMGKIDQQETRFFIDFEEPPESKGLRFLFETEPGKEPRSFMFLPVTGKTVPLGMDDTSVDVGGTGLSVEDLQGFIPKPGEKESILREEKCNGSDCYVIAIEMAEGKGQRQLWISKEDFLVLKTQQIDPRGTVVRTFQVTEFFKTDQGKQFPREEEITIPAKKVRIVIRQEHAVFGIEIPSEVVDPEKFGTFQWKR